MSKSSKPENEQDREKDERSELVSFPSQEPSVPVSIQDMEITEYIAEMLIPLRHLAINADTGFLSYLLEMAIEEAHLQSEKKN